MDVCIGKLRGQLVISLHGASQPEIKITTMDASTFDREKIYENLEIGPKPANYSGRIPWIVQQQISATNGIHFKGSVGRLQEYPIPPIPIPAASEPKLFLDIGNGWGRWLVAAARKNYIPIGIDIRLEFCSTARLVAEDNGFNAYSVVADLRKLPFQAEVFDVVWSFSVIQHTHYDRLVGCLEGIHRTLRNVSGYCYLEFPNRNGMHNRLFQVRKFAATANDYQSWDVRYYTPLQYRDIFMRFFDNFHYVTHSALGIGVLPGDAKYAQGIYNKSGILLSRGLSRFFEIVTPLKAFADSIYIQCYKKPGDSSAQQNGSVGRFLAAHQADPANNLNVVHLLACPATGGALTVSEDCNELISRTAGIAFPIKNNIPIMIVSEARSL